MSILDIYGILTRVGSGRMVCMATAKTPIEIDQEALAVAAEVLGTTTKKDTVNAALREVGQRLVRLRALARLGEMADRGDFDEFLDGKAAYRR
jgi:Arc/MetJ family transcription regulator